MNPTLPTFTFKHHGRAYRLFKRTDSREASFYFHVMIDGKRICRSTGSNQAEEAAKRAGVILDASRGGRWDIVEAVKMRQPPPVASATTTFNQVIAVFLGVPVQASLASRKAYLKCLSLVLSKYGLTPSDPVACFSPDLVARWFSDATKAAMAKPQAEQRRAETNANSIMNQALAVFGQSAMDHYQEAGLEMPDMKPTQAKFRTRRFRGVEVSYSAPSQAIIDATVKQWEDLPYPLAMALGLVLAFGLRKGEARQARWEWLQSVDGYAVLDGSCEVKNGSGRVFARGLDPYCTMWLVLAQDRQGFIIPGSNRDRKEVVWRDMSTWMRGCGWKTTKTAHAWRAYYGSLVALKWGIFEASTRLRHASVTTTEKSYTHFLDRRGLVVKEALPYEWARL